MCVCEGEKEGREQGGGKLVSNAIRFPKAYSFVRTRAALGRASLGALIN